MNPIRKQQLKSYIDLLAFSVLLEDFDGDIKKYLETVANASPEELSSIIEKFEQIHKMVLDEIVKIDENK